MWGLLCAKNVLLGAAEDVCHVGRAYVGQWAECNRWGILDTRLKLVGPWSMGDSLQFGSELGVRIVRKVLLQGRMLGGVIWSASCLSPIFFLREKEDCLSLSLTILRLTKLCVS
jgi:hypothetical protein